MSKQPPIETIDAADLDMRPFDFHPKIKARIEETHAHALNKYLSVDLSDTVTAAKAQADVQMLTTILGLPERIEREEREKMNNGQSGKR